MNFFLYIVSIFIAIACYLHHTEAAKCQAVGTLVGNSIWGGGITIPTYTHGSTIELFKEGQSIIKVDHQVCTDYFAVFSTLPSKFGWAANCNANFFT